MDTRSADVDKADPEEVAADEAEAPGTPEDTGTPEDSDASKGTELRRRPGAWTWLVLLAGIVAVVAAYLSWQDADGDPERARAALRDRAIIEGTAAVETMNSMDYRDVAAGLKAWESVTTGVLHDQLVTIKDDERQLLADQGKIATGHVVQAALTDLTDDTATLIAAVEVTVDDDASGAEPTVKRNRFSADLVLVHGRWKLENLEQVAVNLS